MWKCEFEIDDQTCLNSLSLDKVIINWWLKYIVKNNKTNSRYIWRNLNNFQFWTQLAEKKKEKKKESNAKVLCHQYSIYFEVLNVDFM